MDGQRALDLLQLLQERLIILPGGRDRRGGPIICFPSTSRRERAKPEDYKRLLNYIIGVPGNESKALGFTIIIDMRGNGSASGNVKPILKLLQEHFGSFIHHVVIIKPDNFWQKPRTSIATYKYKFGTTTISQESLGKTVDLTQVTSDIGGSLEYDHTQWINLRLTLEEFLWQASDVLDRIDDLQEDLTRNNFAEDINGAKIECDHHNDMRNKIDHQIKLPVGELGNQGREILAKFDAGRVAVPSNSNSDGAKSYHHQHNNPDLALAINQVRQQLEAVHNAQQHLNTIWFHKKTKLDQCFQLRLFEQDCEKMFDWILHNRDVFHGTYVDIGHNYMLAKNLQEEHQKFAIASMNVCVNLNRIIAVAGRLIEGNHYAAQHIKTVASRLDKTWKEFAAVLDQRTAALALSVAFHHKAEQYADSVSSWAAACEASQALMSDVQNLETAIRTHQSVYEAMCQAYTEVHSTSKQLLYQMDNLVQDCNKPPKDGMPDHRKKENANPAADYAESASHVLAVIHQILGHHKGLENKWHSAKIKLHQRLALTLFQEDVKQVLDWLENHGEVFLRKNTGIGKNLQKAKVYQKSHEHFEKVAQNTYSNAAKLLSAADELANSGEVAPNEIYAVAQELESHVASFAMRVDQRRRRLEAAVSFYTHEKEVSAWIDRYRSEISSDDSLLSQENLDGTERLLQHCQDQRDKAMDGCLKTIEQGEALIKELK